MPLETSLCLGAIEEHLLDLPVLAEERPEIVRNLRIAPDHCVQASFPRT
jgi:hypothetical protein